MNIKITEIIAQDLDIKPHQVLSTVHLLNEGATVPFISRYRKERTGSLDEVQVTQIKELNEKFTELEKRKETILKTIEEQEKLTPELKARIENCFDSVELEDIYLPFKPKRRTKATIAHENGLAPLAKIMMAQNERDISFKANSFLNDKVETVDDALAGARDIVAEWISENEKARNIVRRGFDFEAVISSKIVKGKEEEAAKYRDYFDWKELLKKCPSHRLLAMRRGENEGFLHVSITPNEEKILENLKHFFVKGNTECSEQVALAVKDSLKRLIQPSIENEFSNLSKEKADEEAIKVFAENLKQLLLASPLGQKRILAIDPGYRTGCKLSVVDKTGKVIDTAVIYPTKPQERIMESEKVVTQLIQKHKVDVIAIGNGTASKESEIFIANLLKKLNCGTKYIIVSESGASVYSASKLGAEEFPEFDVTLRSAVSIARRLQDPLAELVKIDPKSIGVGQYQHDMKQARLDEALTGVVEDCVNSVGVDVNTASYSLLSYVAGINASSAKNIVKYREENGEFNSRSEIKKTPKIGAKAFEQCAGFLRIPNSGEVLDNTGIHPESYKTAKNLLQMYGFTLSDVKNGKITGLSERVKNDGLTEVAKILEVGIPTLQDIIKELEKPGRDIRDDFPEPVLRDDIMDANDLKVGMILTGIVRNVIDFGAFVDIGVHQDGLVHVSEISNKYIKHPSEVLSVGDIIKVMVKSVDAGGKKIGLTMKGLK